MFSAPSSSESTDQQNYALEPYYEPKTHSIELRRVFVPSNQSLPSEHHLIRKRQVHDIDLVWDLQGRIRVYFEMRLGNNLMTQFQNQPQQLTWSNAASIMRYVGPEDGETMNVDAHADGNTQWTLGNVVVYTGGVTIRLMDARRNRAASVASITAMGNDLTQWAQENHNIRIRPRQVDNALDDRTNFGDRYRVQPALYGGMAMWGPGYGGSGQLGGGSGPLGKRSNVTERGAQNFCDAPIKNIQNLISGPAVQMNDPWTWSCEK